MSTGQCRHRGLMTSLSYIVLLVMFMRHFHSCVYNLHLDQLCDYGLDLLNCHYCHFVFTMEGDGLVHCIRRGVQGCDGIEGILPLLNSAVDDREMKSEKRNGVHSKLNVQTIFISFLFIFQF